MMFDLQNELIELLKADPYFSDIAAILPVREGDIVRKIDQANGVLTANASGKLGLCVLVMIARMEPQHPNVPGPQFDQISPVVSVLENVEINMGSQGIQKPSEDVAEYVAAVLHGRLLDSMGGVGIYCKAGIQLADDPKYHGYNVGFRCEGQLQYRPTQVAKPTWDSIGLQISCATAGATLYFTTDGTRPTPTNYFGRGTTEVGTGPSPLYGGGIDVGTTIKVRAYKTGLRASELLTFVE